MKAVGIICEYNPFHYGHLYHINETKKIFKDLPIILVLSSSFVQRGEPSILTKWEKTDLALTYGVDLVVELPFAFSCQNADIFAKGSIALLKELNVSYLVFGSESNNVDKLKEMANIQLNDPNYELLVKKELDKGINYPTALSNALKLIKNEEVNTPNDILGLSYIREIIKQKALIEVISIKRTNSYHDEMLTSSITSATSIRQALKQNIDIKNTVPSEVLKYLNKDIITINDYFDLLKYKVLTNINCLDKYHGIDEGLNRRIMKFINDANNYDNLIELIKTKRYTYQRIKRVLLYILCEFTKKKAIEFKEITYVRVLGFNKIGQSYLKEHKKYMNIPVVTRFASLNDEMLKYEAFITSIYSLVFDINEQKEQNILEYKNLIKK